MDFNHSTDTISPDLAAFLTIGGTGALVLPSGSTAARPGSASVGALRWNTDLVQAEVWNGTAWAQYTTGSGGGGTVNTGTATIDFGTGAQEASIAVTGQTSILTTSNILVVFDADSTTTNHTASDHRYAGLFIALSAGTIVAGTGFTIEAFAMDKQTGQFKITWQWS